MENTLVDVLGGLYVLCGHSPIRHALTSVTACRTVTTKPQLSVRLDISSIVPRLRKSDRGEALLTYEQIASLGVEIKYGMWTLRGKKWLFLLNRLNMLVMWASFILGSWSQQNLLVSTNL